VSKPMMRITTSNSSSVNPRATDRMRLVVIGFPWT
jgi:hypothetical protein